MFLKDLAYFFKVRGTTKMAQRAVSFGFPLSNSTKRGCPNKIITGPTDLPFGEFLGFPLIDG